MKWVGEIILSFRKDLAGRRYGRLTVLSYETNVPLQTILQELKVYRMTGGEISGRLILR